MTRRYGGVYTTVTDDGETTLKYKIIDYKNESYNHPYLLFISIHNPNYKKRMYLGNDLIPAKRTID